MLWLLVVWYGIGQSGVAYAVPAIASQQECDRLGAVIKSDGWAQKTRCYPYRGGKP